MAFPKPDLFPGSFRDVLPCRNGQEVNGETVPKPQPTLVPAAKPNAEFVEEFRRKTCESLESHYAGKCNGRGIVICAGGWSMLAGVYVTCSLLRWDALNSRLPVEIWTIGDNGELDPIFKHITKHLNVTWRDASEELRQLGIERHEKLRGWAIKPLALLLSSFDEVVMFDADCYPTYDPERLMDDPIISKAGAAFWRDNPGNVAGQPLTEDQWALFGMEPPQESIPGFESGQIYFNKRKHWAAVKLLAWLSDRFDEFDATRGLAGGLHGDKDVFSIAMRATESDYWMAPPVRHCEVAFLQPDRRGEVFTVHRCQDKLRLTRGWHHTPQKFEHTNHRSTVLHHEHMVHVYLNELRTMLRPDIPGFRDGTQDEQIWREIRIQNAYRLPPAMDGMRVLDVGAHAGFFTLECLRRGADFIIAIEPWRANAQLCRMNLAAWSRKCRLYEVAVAEPSATEVFMRDSTFGVTQTGEPHVSSEGIPVATMALDEAIVETANGGRVDILKIDAEGAEYPALMTATKLDLVDRIVGEWHSVGCKNTIDELSAKLSADGFSVEVTRAGEGIGMFFAERSV